MRHKTRAGSSLHSTSHHANFWCTLISVASRKTTHHFSHILAKLHSLQTPIDGTPKQQRLILHMKNRASAYLQFCSRLIWKDCRYGTIIFVIQIPYWNLQIIPYQSEAIISTASKNHCTKPLHKTLQWKSIALELQNLIYEDATWMADGWIVKRVSMNYGW